MRLYSYLPSLDLHGMDTVIAKLLIEEFICDQKKMKNKECLRKITCETLKRSPLVLEAKLDRFNPGCTIVKLK